MAMAAFVASGVLSVLAAMTIGTRLGLGLLVVAASFAACFAAAVLFHLIVPERDGQDYFFLFTSSAEFSTTFQPASAGHSDRFQPRRRTRRPSKRHSLRVPKRVGTVRRRATLARSRRRIERLLGIDRDAHDGAASAA